MYITGESDGGSATKTDLLVAAYNASTGAQLWIDRYDGGAAKADVGYAIAVDVSGDVAVTGTSTGVGSKFDYVTRKYAGGATGPTVLWTQRYDGALKNDYAFDIKIDGPGNVYVTGSSDGASKTGFLTIKYNAAGTQQWASRYNNTPANKNDYGYTLAVDASGNVYVAGASGGAGTKLDYAVVKYNSSGGQLWVRRYDSGIGKDDIARGIAVSSVDGAVDVTGSSDQGGGRKLDYLTLKLNQSTGAVIWKGRYNGVGMKNDIAYNVAVRAIDNSIVVSGTSDGGTTTKLDFVTVSGPANAALPGPITTPAIPDGDEDGATGVPKVFTLYQNYPNPFNPTTTISFTLSKSSFVSLKVYNMLGQEVAELVQNELMDEGMQEVELNANALASGVYFYRLTAKEIADEKNGTVGSTLTSVKKMLLLK